MTFTELKTEVDTLYASRTLDDWKAQSIYRDVIRRSQKDFDWLKSMYPAKVGRIVEKLAISTDKEEQVFLTTKMARIRDKFATVCMEEKMRADGDVVRTNLHHQADFYIDYDNGDDDNNDGSSVVKTNGDGPWKTITKYTTDTVRTPGDRAFLRAGITWDQGTEAVDITMDEDGTQDDYISIIGCDSVTNDPWSDASDVNPIVDFEAASFQLKDDDLDYWYIEKTDFTNSADAHTVYLQDCYHIYIKDLEISNQGGNGIGLSMLRVEATVDTVTFTDNGRYNINAVGATSLVVKNCVFNGTDSGTECRYGIFNTGCRIYVSDSTFGVTHAHNNNDIFGHDGSITWVRNCTWNTANGVDTASIVDSEDDDATFEAHITTAVGGVITRDAGTVRGGGADSSAKMEPAADCGANNPLVLGTPLDGFAQVWVAAGSYTATVYASVGSAWDSALTAAECYMVTSELDNGANATRVKRQSAQQIDNDTTWTAFTTSISPAREGFVYFWFYLEEYEDATEHVFVDIKPTIA